ncbi:MAG: BON domain-containing protein [Nitrospinota bacterium]|nr:BON domain-containing protein [Nitrospinota bacterium]
MRIQMLLIPLAMALAVSGPPALAHNVEGEKSQAHYPDGSQVESPPEGGQSFSEKNDNAGPLERAGKELDKALGRTINVISNSALELRVKNHLHSHSVPWREIMVNAESGNVRLEGEVATRDIYIRVEEIVKQTHGVKSVVNKLTVKSDQDPLTL